MTAAALQDAVAALTRLGCKPTPSGNGYKALCPIHEADGRSHTPSLTVAAGDTQPIVVCCQTGCDGREILKALGINGTAHKSANIVATYRYQDATGRDIREKLRYEPKDFRIRHKDAAGNWAYKAGDGPPVLYRLPEVKSAIAEGRTVFVCEGEKDCDRLASAGLVATTNIEGAAKPEQRPKWKTEYTAQLSGAARVVLIPDNDEPGKAHMRHIAAQLAGKVSEVRWLELPGLPPKGDVSDWLNKGHTLEELKGLVGLAPSPEPPAEPEPAREPGTADAGTAGADPAKLARLFQTDLGNSERLVARHGQDLRYCFDFGKWLCWDGVRWAIDRDGAAMDKAKMTARAMLEEAATLPDREDSRKLAAWSFRSQARERMAAALFLAQSDVPVRPEHLDTHPWLLNVQNGTLDLRTGTLQPAARADLMTKAAPVAYDPNATCPEWLAFLDRIFDGNKELIRYVQKAAGYSLTGDDREQAFFVCYGTGRNGKSTLLETLAAVLGDDYGQQAAPELLMQKTHDRHPTELAALRGMRLVTAIETGEGKRLNEPLVKQLTGGDRISARFMHGDFFTFTPTHKLWLATNHKPTIRGTDLGMWRRIKLIPFSVQIPDEEKDDGLKARLRSQEARQGILNWMLEGALLWKREGLKPPQAVSDATQTYREEMDVLAAWLADCCFVKKVAEASAADLYRSYVKWREANGERAETQTSFGLRLTERGFERVKRRNGWVWYGVGLLACDPCDPCDPNFGNKDSFSGELISKPVKGVTPVTPVTPYSADALSSQHPPVDTRQGPDISHGNPPPPADPLSPLDMQKVGGVGGVGGVGEDLTKAANIDGQGRQGRQTVGGLETVINQEDNPKAAKTAKTANISGNGEESPPDTRQGPDISSTAPAESHGTPATWADISPDISHDNPLMIWDSNLGEWISEGAAS